MESFFLRHCTTPATSKHAQQPLAGALCIPISLVERSSIRRLLFQDGLAVPGVRSGGVNILGLR